MTEFEQIMKELNEFLSGKMTKEETYKKYFPSLYKTEDKIEKDSRISIPNILMCHWFCSMMRDFANDEDLLAVIGDLQNYVKTNEQVKVNDVFYKFKNGVVYSYDFQNLLLTLKAFSITIRSVMADSLESKRKLVHYLSIINELLLKKAIIKAEIENMTSYEYVECAFLKLLQEEFENTIYKLQESEIENDKGI